VVFIEGQVSPLEEIIVGGEVNGREGNATSNTSLV